MILDCFKKLVDSLVVLLGLLLITTCYHDCLKEEACLALLCPEIRAEGEVSDARDAGFVVLDNTLKNKIDNNH